MRVLRSVEILLVQSDDREGRSLRADFDATGLLSVVETVPDGTTALAALRGKAPFDAPLSPSLILVDLSNGDGDESLERDLELLSELKSDAELRAIPVVVLTSSHATADVLNAYSHGACSFVCKPESPDERRRLINRFSQYWAQVAQLPHAVDRRSDEPLPPHVVWHDDVPQDGELKSVEVLVVDDSDDDVVLLQEAFGDCPMVNFVKTVEDGEAAIRYLKRQAPYENAKRPGLVLLDINMPRKNGFEVLAEIRADPELRQVPIVMLTTSKQESDILRAYSNGACSFISKPVNFQKMKQIAQHFAVYWTTVADVPRA